jgi:hypothetical protein
MHKTVQTQQSGTPIRPLTAEERAVRLTLAWLALPVIGSALWIIGMIMIDITWVHSYGGMSVFCIIFGIPAWAGISFGIRALYRRAYDKVTLGHVKEWWEY